MVELKENDNTCQFNSESGLGLIEIIASISILTIVGFGISMSLVTGIRVHKHTQINYAARSLAVSRLEEYAAIETTELDDNYDDSETGITTAGTTITFARVTNVTVNSDDSRTVEVTVSSENHLIDTSVNFVTTFAVWE